RHTTGRRDPRAHQWPDGLPMGSARLPAGRTGGRGVPRQRALGAHTGTSILGGNAVQALAGNTGVPRVAGESGLRGLGRNGRPEPGVALPRELEAHDDMTDVTAEIRFSELLKDAPSNWGRWGPDDELGALNYMTSVEVLRGVAEVRDGR